MSSRPMGGRRGRRGCGLGCVASRGCRLGGRGRRRYRRRHRSRRHRSRAGGRSCGWRLGGRQRAGVDDGCRRFNRCRLGLRRRGPHRAHVDRRFAARRNRRCWRRRVNRCGRGRGIPLGRRRYRRVAWRRELFVDGDAAPDGDDPAAHGAASAHPDRRDLPRVDAEHRAAFGTGYVQAPLSMGVAVPRGVDASAGSRTA